MDYEVERLASFIAKYIDGSTDISLEKDMADGVRLEVKTDDMPLMVLSVDEAAIAPHVYIELINPNLNEIEVNKLHFNNVRQVGSQNMQEITDTCVLDYVGNLLYYTPAAELITPKDIDAVRKRK